MTRELEIRARPTLSEGAMTLLLTEDMPALNASIDALGALVHETLPGHHVW